MTRYADPDRCPDCGAVISPGTLACARCGLSLRGETAQRLFTTLLLADQLLAALRAASAPAASTDDSPTNPEAASAPSSATAPAPAPGASPGVAGPAAGHLTPYPATPTAPRRRHGLTATSVPTILLALGAGCLLVAALVFLAVTWSRLGIGGRTATLVGCTALAAALAGWMARRPLRAAAESLALVGYGLFTLDVLGADRAGWLGDLSTAGLQRLLGALLVLAGLGGARAARRSPLAALTGAEVVVAAGAAIAALGVGGGDLVPVAPSLVLATLLAAAVTAAAHRLGLRVAAIGTAAVTAAAWVSLTGYAVDRVFSQPGWSELWRHGRGWPLLVAAGLAAAPAVLRRLPAPARVAALGVAELLLMTALLAPASRLHATGQLLVALGVLVAVGAATWLLPRPWGLVGVLTQAVTGATVAVTGLALFTEAAVRLGRAAEPVWSGHAADRLPVALPWAGEAGELGWSDQPAGWVLPLVVLVLTGTLWVLAGASPAVDTAVRPVTDLRLGAAVVSASLVAGLALYPVPLWLALAALMVVAVGFTAWWLRTGSLVPAAPGTLFAGAAVLGSLHAELLSAVVLSLVLALAATMHLQARSTAVAAVAGTVLAGLLAGSVWSWAAVADVEPAWAALAGLLVLGAVALLAPYAPALAASTGDPGRARAGLEVGAAAAAWALAGGGVMGSPAGQEATWTAVYLTVTGALVTMMSLLRPDRRVLAWVGGALLAAATWVRLADLGVSAPEAYTMPTAVALVVVGLDRLRRDPSLSSVATLTPGLGLLLVPSLLWSLEEPTGLRPLLLGLGCLLLVLAGARLGWTAPLASGAATGALLVLRLSAPYVGDALPRWVLIGAAGALLIAVGATWERRLADARSVLGYVRALR